jgi:hypothetical protein
MKAKANIPEKSNPAPARPRQVEIEEPVTSRLSLIEEIMPFLGIGPEPNAMDCEDMNLRAYRRALALVDYMGSRDDDLKEEGVPEEAASPYFAEVLQLQIELGRLTAKRLFRLYNDNFAAQSQQSA